MKFASIILTYALLAVPAIAQLTTVTWNSFYDNPNQTLSIIACAEWAAANNFSTLSDVPAFPFIGGSSVVSGFNSSHCGTCFSILDEKTGITVEVLVVDAATTGFVISLEALNAATNNNAKNLGSIQANVTQNSNVSTCNP